jgi:hypothetical protein
MTQGKTESQMHAAGMLLVLECALNDLYPGRVSGTGSLWNRRITVWLNDIEDMIIDFSSEEGIRTSISRTDKGSGDSGIPEGDFGLALDADLEAIHNFNEAVVIEAAYCVNLDPKSLVQNIADIAANASRVRQAMANLEAPQTATPFQPF